MSVQIHGKTYITVAERIQKAHNSLKQIQVMTEVLFQNPVVIKATVKVGDLVYTGISAANPDKMMEKESPYEIAETSAVGRALAFAGFESENIASADEMQKGKEVEKTQAPSASLGKCVDCGFPNIIYKTSGKLGCSKYCWKNK